MQKKEGLPDGEGPPFFVSICERLALDDGASGASAGAGAARNASVLVNLVDVAFADSSNGAFVDAGAASYADVSDFVSHFFFCFLGLIIDQFLCFKASAKVRTFSDMAK